MPGTDSIGPRAAQTARLATLGRLTRGALHELGNPLVALLGTAELVAMGAEPGTKLRDRLDLIGATADEIAAVVRALQSVARVGDGDDVERIELSTETAAALALVERLNPGVEHLLEGTYPDDPTVVETRAGALLIALVALFVDAIESAPPGTIAITVSKGNDAASVSVAGARAGDQARVLAEAAGALLEERDDGTMLTLPLGR